MAASAAEGRAGLKLGPRYESEENLTQALKRIVFNNPQRSPLLLPTRQSERYHKEVFDGQGGEESRKQLEAWVLKVSLEQSAIRMHSQGAAGVMFPPMPAPSTSPSSPPVVPAISSGTKNSK